MGRLSLITILRFVRMKRVTQSAAYEQLANVDENSVVAAMRIVGWGRGFERRVGF